MDQHAVYSQSPKIGKFSLLDEVLGGDANRPWLQALFGLCVVLETQRDESGRGVQYIAASELFQPLAEGEEIPKYRIECDLARAFTPEERAKALESRRFLFYAVRQHVVRVPALALETHAKQLHFHSQRTH